MKSTIKIQKRVLPRRERVEAKIANVKKHLEQHPTDMVRQKLLETLGKKL